MLNRDRGTIENRIKLKLKKKLLCHKTIENDICPKCGGDLYQDSDIGIFVEMFCEECDFETIIYQ